MYTILLHTCIDLISYFSKYLVIAWGTFLISIAFWAKIKKCLKTLSHTESIWGASIYVWL